MILEKLIIQQLWNGRGSLLEKASDLRPWEGMISFCFGCQPWQPWPGLPTRSAVQDHTWV